MKGIIRTKSSRRRRDVVGVPEYIVVIQRRKPICVTHMHTFVYLKVRRIIDFFSQTRERPCPGTDSSFREFVLSVRGIVAIATRGPLLCGCGNGIDHGVTQGCQITPAGLNSYNKFPIGLETSIFDV